VVLATEAFGTLVKVSLNARKTPEKLAVVIKGNPELLEYEATTKLADRVFDEIAARLTDESDGGGHLVA
jgi:hypothetical protein